MEHVVNKYLKKGLTKVASAFSMGFGIRKSAKFLFSCASASNTVTEMLSA